MNEKLTLKQYRLLSGMTQEEAAYYLGGAYEYLRFMGKGA